jgi:hypothetical protein
MARRNNVYESHLLSSVTNKEDQNVLLRAAELQCSGRKHDARLEYENLTPASRSIPGISIYEIRLMLMKGDFRAASSRLEDIIGQADLGTSPLDALMLLMKSHCDVFTQIKLQEAVNVARQVRRVWLEPMEIHDVTDTFVGGTYFLSLNHVNIFSPLLTIYLSIYRSCWSITIRASSI